MGRIELISAHQRAALEKLYSLPEDAFPKVPLYIEKPEVLKKAGDPSLSHTDLYRAAGRAIPQALSQYESLGRFRDALLRHELGRATENARRERLKSTIASFSACADQPQHAE